ncbi:unnamed protein product [Schistosoma turkestanicum]|nr:unnamed protein product [Schistosoma turkestanicum]
MWLTDARRLTSPNTVIFLIGNKADLDEKRDVTYEEARQLAEENGLMFLECSAKSGENVEEVFIETARKIFKNVQDGSVYLNSVDGGVLSKGSLTSGNGRNSVELGNTTTTNGGTRQSGCAC